MQQSFTNTLYLSLTSKHKRSKNKQLQTRKAIVMDTTKNAKSLIAEEELHLK